MDFAQQLRAARAALEWTQRDLADRSGVSEPTIRNIEGGSNEPNATTRKKLVDALQASGLHLTSYGIEHRIERVLQLHGEDW